MNALPQSPQRCPLDTTHLRPDLDFPHWWQRAAVLVGLPAHAEPSDLSLTGIGLSQLLKQLRSLDDSRRALLLTMACLANPDRADWLQREQGLHFGQLTAADLGTDVFQVLVGLLANFPQPKHH
ncbi:hypothetical protein D9M69_704390 [compost metagenome]